MSRKSRDFRAFLVHVTFLDTGARALSRLVTRQKADGSGWEKLDHVSRFSHNCREPDTDEEY